MKTIKQLKDAGKFVVEEWMDVYRAKGITSPDTGYKTCEYQFEYSKDGEMLYISGHVFGTEKTEISNPEAALYNLAREEYITEVALTTTTGIPFFIHNPKIRFYA